MRATLWPLEPQTVGKHKVLKEYLNAWLPIMGSWAGRILFIDGFAGPGKYTGGDPGSPLIALDALIQHSGKRYIKSKVIFFFIERDHERANHLKTLVGTRQSSLPDGCEVHVIEGTFDETMTQVLNHLDEKRTSLAPSFLMIDPFGGSGTPMSIVERVLAHPRSEVYVSFMYEAMNRFKATEEFIPHLDALFGCSEWRDGVQIEDATCRKDFFYGLYEKQLRHASAEHVIRFELYREDKLIYAIFFATKHERGCDRMKQAIWKVAPFGDFQFRGTRSAQLDLGLVQADFEPLKNALRQEFRSKGWVTIEQVTKFVASDRTDYHTGQHKSRALAPMEDAGEIEVDPDTRNRRRTYPKGTRLRFL